MLFSKPFSHFSLFITIANLRLRFRQSSLLRARYHGVQVSVRAGNTETVISSLYSYGSLTVA